MRVTLDVFSGRPNPSWELTETEASEFRDHCAGCLEAMLDQSALRALATADLLCRLRVRIMLGLRSMKSDCSTR
jgi:hypothetical protein